MKLTIAAALLGLTTLSACEAGFTDDISRLSTMLPILPKAADREGIYALREIRGSILVQYIPAEVSQSQVLSRLTKYCARKGGVPRRTSPSSSSARVTLSNGHTVTTRSFVAQCR